jgi:hypothetical protein
MPTRVAAALRQLKLFNQAQDVEQIDTLSVSLKSVVLNNTRQALISADQTTARNTLVPVVNLFN